jgi:hypothetical protein
MSLEIRRFGVAAALVISLLVPAYSACLCLHHDEDNQEAVHEHATGEAFASTEGLDGQSCMDELCVCPAVEKPASVKSSVSCIGFDSHSVLPPSLAVAEFNTTQYFPSEPQVDNAVSTNYQGADSLGLLPSRAPPRL